MTRLTIAFLPLTDCAILVAAKEKGFAGQHGLELDLKRDTSWATVRDRLITGQVQCAQLLAPLAVAVSLGLGQYPAALSVPFKLSVNGNAITFSRELSARLGDDRTRNVQDPAEAARMLAESLPDLPRKPVIAVVHRFSSHVLALRYWLASAGIDPDRDVALCVLPPSMMTAALASGEIDGFTAGEPWNSNAVETGIGEIVAIGARIWESGPEKVLAMREDWMESNAGIVSSLLLAMDEAARWCAAPENWGELISLLAQPQYVGLPAEVIAPAIYGKFRLAPGGEMFDQPNFLHLHRHAANFPWRSQALWIYSQLVRWGFLEASEAAEAAATRVFRSDVYRDILTGGTTPVPSASLKVEGSLPSEIPVASGRGRLTLGPDRFFDGRVFDPHRIGEYLAGQMT